MVPNEMLENGMGYMFLADLALLGIKTSFKHKTMGGYFFGT